MDGVDPRAFALDHFAFCTGDDENVLIIFGSVLDVVDLFVNVTFYATAQRRIELR